MSFPLIEKGEGDVLFFDCKDDTCDYASEENIKKILSGNLLRVWRTVEAYAAAN